MMTQHLITLVRKSPHRKRANEDDVTMAYLRCGLVCCCKSRFPFSSAHRTKFLYHELVTLRCISILTILKINKQCSFLLLSSTSPSSFLYYHYYHTLITSFHCSFITISHGSVPISHHQRWRARHFILHFLFCCISKSYNGTP